MTWLYMLIGFFLGSAVLYTVIRSAVGAAINDALTSAANNAKAAELRAKQGSSTQDWG